MRSSGAKWLAIAGVSACLAALPLAATGQSPRSATGCFPTVAAEYCFPGGSLMDLVPLDSIMQQGLERAEELKAMRTGPSRVSPARREALNAMWREAVQEAYTYATNHSLTIGLLAEPAQYDGESLSPLSPVFDAVSEGPLLRLNFRETDGVAFEMVGPVLIHRPRMQRLLNNLMREAPDQYKGLIMLFSAYIVSLPGEGNFVDVAAVTRMPAIQPFVAHFEKTMARSDMSFLGTLGVELIMILYLAVEETIREHSAGLPHAIHFYSDGSRSSDEMDSPQVVWSGELLMSDEAIIAFSDEELQLLMRHEALHLMRANFFLVLSAADLTQRTHFPALNTERSATFLNNLLGRDSPGREANCPLDVSEDDELFTDYFVFYLYRNEPEKQRAYHDLLKRLHREFDRGANAQAAYRVALADTLMEHFAQRDALNTDAGHKDALFWQAIGQAISNNLPQYLGGRPPRMDDYLVEIEKHPDIALEAKMIRISIQYYRREALLKDGWVPDNTAFSMTCERLESLMKTGRAAR